MRMRSPRIAPPVDRLEGSTAIIATVFPRRRHSAARASTSELLPAPGGPVMPIMSPSPSARPAGNGAPFSIDVASRAISRAVIRLIVQQLAGDHQSLDFTGALANCAEFDVAIELLDRIVLDESIAAEDLNGFIGDPHRGFGCEQLGHCGFASDPLAGIDHLRGPVSEQTRGIDLHCHIDQLVLNRLKFRDGAAELLADLRVFQSCIVRSLGHANGESCDGNAAAIQNAQAVDKTLARLAQKLRSRKPAIRKHYLAGCARAQPELVFFL